MERVATQPRSVVEVVRLLLVAGVVSFSSTARGDGVMTGAPRGPVEWKTGKWDRFTPAEGVFTAAMTGVSYARRWWPVHTEPNLDFEVPVIDPGMRALFRVRDPVSQAVWAGWTDVGFRTLAFFPYVVDAGVMALGVHRNPDVAAQLFLIDLESFTLAAAVHQFTSRWIARPRPYVQLCADDGYATRYACGDRSDLGSFYAGHASAAFTAAGLTCVHHQHIPLWGGGAVDAWACAWALSFASLTALGRIPADEHWASDVFVGMGTGWLAGYVMPLFLHYGTGRSRPATIVGGLLSPKVSTAFGISVTPTFLPSYDGGMFGVRGTL